MASIPINGADSRRRVVITGMGVIAPNGSDLPNFWRTIREGVSAARLITRFDASKLPYRVAAEIPDFDPSRYMGVRKARRFERAIQYEIAAARLALEDAHLSMSRLDPDRVGIVDGTATAGLESAANSHRAFLERGYRGMSAYTFVNVYSGAGAGEVALELGIKGHAITYCSGCASANDGLGYALRMIQTDEVDVMIAGGADAPIVEGFWSGFSVAKVMTTRNDIPARAMRPFDRTRDGFVMGEGAGFMVLEELAHALDRRAKIYAEVLGHGRSCEAFHSVLPHPEGLGTVRAMEKALRDARLHHTQIDYINAHGTASVSSDLAETRAIKRLFGADARRVAVGSTKPVTGHLLGAAGALETVICALALHHREIPPTVNLREPGEECDLDYVPDHFRPYPVRYAMNLNSGFGGKNSCLILGRYPADA